MRVVDSGNFPVASGIAGAMVTIKPGGLREMHWHPNVSEWQYWIRGKGRMTVVTTGAEARTMDFNANDLPLVGYFPQRVDCALAKRHGGGSLEDIRTNDSTHSSTEERRASAAVYPLSDWASADTGSCARA